MVKQSYTCSTEEFVRKVSDVFPRRINTWYVVTGIYILLGKILFLELSYGKMVLQIILVNDLCIKILKL